MRRLLLVLIVSAMCLPLGQVVPAAAAPPVHAAGQAVVPEAVPVKAAPKKSPYRCWRSAKPTCKLAGGVTFSNAYGTNPQKYAVINKIISSIRRTPATASIQVMSWNILSAEAVNALIDAAKRGVRVRVIMDATNQSKDVPNPGFTKLVKAFRASNVGKTPTSRRSYAMKCQGSCRRGNAASAHAKYYMFSQVGASKNVVMQGSANLTNAAARNQWNDLFTYVNNPDLYGFVNGVFNEMWQDKYVEPTWTSFVRPTFEMHFSPRLGGETDPLTYQLQNVQCKGASPAGTANGRTIIRSAPDVLRGQWGLAVATELRRLWEDGCDIRIGYTVIGIDVKQLLQKKTGRGPVPLKQFAADRNGDKVLDEYFHLKAWTINGRSTAGGTDNKNYYWTMNGSSNISDLSRISDENIGVFKYKSVTMQYQNFIDRWWANPPKSRPAIPSLVPKNLDPYANMEKDF